MTALESNIGNAVEVTLDAQLNSGSGNTTLDMASDPGITAPAYLVLNPDNDSKREVVKWVSGAFGSATIERDKDNKNSGNGYTHAAGDTVRQAVVKQHFEDVHDAIQQGFILEDGDGTEVEIKPAVASGEYTAREIKFVEGAGIDINWSDVTDGTDADPYDLTFTVGGLTTSEIAAGSLVTESETIASNDNDTTLPTSAAVKDYADSGTATLTNKTLGAVTLSGAVTGGDQTISAAILKDYAETDQDITSGTTLTIDLANGNTGSVTLAHSVTDVDFTNVPAAGISTFTCIFTQDGTGSRTLATNAVTVNTSAATVKTPNAGGLTLSTAASAIDIVTFIFKDAGTTVFVIPQLAFG